MNSFLMSTQSMLQTPIFCVYNRFYWHLAVSMMEQRCSCNTAHMNQRPDDWGERDGWIGIDVLDCVTEVEMQRMYGHEHHFHLCAVFKWIYISNHSYSYMIFYNMKFLFFGNSYKYWWFVVLFIIRSLYRCSIYTTLASFSFEIIRISKEN